MTPKTKLFLRASVGSAGFNTHLVGVINGGTAKGYQGNFSHGGLFYGLGVGASSRLSRHWILGFEGDHLWLSAFTNVTGVPQGGGSPTLVSVNFKPTVNEVKLSLLYQFN